MKEYIYSVTSNWKSSHLNKGCEFWLLLKDRSSASLPNCLPTKPEQVFPEFRNWESASRNVLLCDWYALLSWANRIICASGLSMSQAGTGTYALFSFAPFCTFPAFPNCLLLSDPDLPHPSSCVFEALPYLKVSHSLGISLKWWDEAYVSMNSSSLQLLFLRIHVLRHRLAVR